MLFLLNILSPLQQEFKHRCKGAALTLLYLACRDLVRLRLADLANEALIHPAIRLAMNGKSK